MDNKQQLLAAASREIAEFQRSVGSSSDDYIPPPDMSLAALAYDNLAPSVVIKQSEGITFSKSATNKDVSQETLPNEINIPSGRGKKKGSNNKKSNNPQPVTDNGSLSNIILETLTQSVRSIHQRLDDIEYQLKENNIKKQAEVDEGENPPTEPLSVEFRFGFGVKYEFNALTRHDYDDFIVLTIPQGSFKINIDSGSSPQDTYLSFDGGAELIPGFLLGKPFCVDPTSNTNTELLVFLRNPPE